MFPVHSGCNAVNSPCMVSLLMTVPCFLCRVFSACNVICSTDVYNASLMNSVCAHHVVLHWLKESVWWAVYLGEKK